MKKIFTICCCLFVGNQIGYAQSFRDFFSKKNVAKVASTIGLETPLEIEGEWKYAGTAIELETEDTFKRAAASLAAVAAEEKINQQLGSLGVDLESVVFEFNNEGDLTIKALNKSIPAQYQLTEDKKSIKLSVMDKLGVNANLKHSLNTMSFLFEADKLIDVVSYISKKIDHSTLKAISSLAEKYDGMKVGIQLEKIN